MVMYRSQQHSQRSQRIVTRKPESGIVLTRHMGKIKLVHVAFSLGKIIQWRPLAFCPCGVQGKLKFLLIFGFILLLRYFVHPHIEILPVLVSDGSSKFVSLIQNTSKFELPYLLVFCRSHLVSSVFHAVRSKGLFLQR